MIIKSVLKSAVTLVTLASLLSSVSAQVNSEIDQFEDLLAVDSFANEVIVDRPRQRFNKKLVSRSRPLRKFAGGARRNRLPVSEGSRVEKKMNLDGSYRFRYSTKDGMFRQETGKPSSSGSLVQSGSWSYTGADGKQHEMLARRARARKARQGRQGRQGRQSGRRQLS